MYKFKVIKWLFLVFSLAQREVTVVYIELMADTYKFIVLQKFQ